MTFPIKNMYLEDILAMTDYRIRPRSPKRFRGKAMGYKEDIEYTQLMTPFIEELEAKRSYPYHVMKSLRMRESEEAPDDLIVELLTHICNNEGISFVYLTCWFFAFYQRLIWLMMVVN